MPQKPFLPRPEGDRQTWLNQFVDSLQNPVNGYAAKYGIPAATVTALDQGRQWVNWIMANLETPRATAGALTAFKNNLFNGSGTPLIPVQVPFTAVPAFPPIGGIFILAGSVGTQIKKAVNYDTADGQDMGLEGATLAAPDPVTIAPDLSNSRLASGGLVEIVWTKGRMSALRIDVDRADGKGRNFLAVDTEPNYIDTVKPAADITAIYTYYAIYLLGDEPFGQWSQPFQIPVRG